MHVKPCNSNVGPQSFNCQENVWFGFLSAAEEDDEAKVYKSPGQGLGLWSQSVGAQTVLDVDVRKGHREWCFRYLISS
jgi:hypothetical protein